MLARTWYSIFPSSVTTQWLKLRDGRMRRNNSKISSVAIASSSASLEMEEGREESAGSTESSLLWRIGGVFPRFAKIDELVCGHVTPGCHWRNRRKRMWSWQTSSWIFVSALKRATDWIRYSACAGKLFDRGKLLIMQEYRLYEINELANVKGGGSGTTMVQCVCGVLISTV